MLEFSTYRVALLFLGGWLVFVAFKILRFVLKPLFSPIRRINGPPGGHLIYGKMREIRGSEGRWHETQVKKYGHVFRYKGIFRVFIRNLYLVEHYIHNLTERKSLHYRSQGVEPHLNELDHLSEGT